MIMRKIVILKVLVMMSGYGALAQFLGPVQHQPPHFQQQLSPQQQGHILSDIQQHQHRFSAPQSTFTPQQFNNPPFFHQQSHLSLLNQNQQLAQQNQHLLQAQKLLETQLKNLNVLTQPQNQLNNPEQRLQNTASEVQHHTQTSFTPSFTQSETPSLQYQPRPTVDPILSIEQEIRSLDPDKQKQRIKELREKQSIIEKHNQFVERQYEKALKKAREEHEQWLEEQKDEKKKLYQKLYKPPEAQVIRYMQSIPRYIYPEEVSLFKKSVEKYYEEHPTTTTTTTTTPAPTTTTKKSIFSKKLGFLPTVVPTSASSKVKTIQSLEDLNLLQKQYKQQQIARDDLLNQLRQAIGSGGESSRNLTSREIALADGKKIQLIQTSDPKFLPKGKTEEISLPNGQRVQVIRADDPKDELTLPSGQKIQLLKPDTSVKTQEIVLPNGERVEIIKTNDPKLAPGATPLEPGSDLEKLLLAQTTTPKTEYLDEFPKDVVPPGADFELLKTGASGGLEQVQNITNKKVTFVLLEEQDDGSLKVRGVKGNGKDKPEVDVDSILKRIKNGEIKLPKNVEESTRKSSVSVVPNSYSNDEVPVLKTNIGTNFVATSTPSATVYTKIFPGESSTSRPSSTPRPSSTSRLNSTPRPSTTTHKPSRSVDLLKQASSVSSPSQNSLFSKPKPTQSTVTIYKSISTTPTYFPEQHDLSDVLKKNGLFAMAKFLKQSGLDTILNETGPYTIFVPTDKAFRTLLVQLGGPEKAEEKFKDNPRLLSGLLLHHVIPGAFTIGSLQDEMTGVSLAGTQLRVNQYSMHDVEWNDVKVTTINGAKVMDDKQDIEIPQGIAHAVDRVMFPLPVGDILQTLQSDRERRFTTFLRALFSAGLADTLQGSKTFTLFAPTDKAFASLSTEELSRTVSDRTSARDLIFRHLTTGTLYTNGMRYYQIKDSLQPDKQLTLSKQSGKVKVNNIQLATQNIPATNGVIHAIDTLL